LTVLTVISLLINTVLLRPYVFVFLGVSLAIACKLLGWPRTLRFFGVTWGIAFLCEYSSTRIGIPFGDYYYTGSTVGEELYISNIPFMDSLSFSFLLFASYCVALAFILPNATRMDGSPVWRFDPKIRLSWPVIILTVMLFVFSDVVIDPVALRGNRWFLGQIYGYPHEGIYFGVPLANFAGWGVVGVLSLLAFKGLERFKYADQPVPNLDVGREILLGVGLYYGVLAFNLSVTFWVGERFLGLVGCLIFTPITVLLMIRLWKLKMAGIPG
jgi:uncharacterized membrane protein